MGGVDKGLQPFGGQPLVAHVVERLAPQVERLIISANRNLDEYRAFGHPVVGDRDPGYPGPLAGLHAGLLACGTPLLLAAPCDAPWLPRDLAPRLRDALLNEGADAAVPRTADGWQPVFVLLRRDVLAGLEATLAAGDARVRNWLRGLRLAIVDFADASTFANLNTREELAAAACRRD